MHERTTRTIDSVKILTHTHYMHNLIEVKEKKRRERKRLVMCVSEMNTATNAFR